MIAPYYDDGQIVIYHGDCRDVLPTLTVADFIFDDPPYKDGDWWHLYDLLAARSHRLVVTPGILNAVEWTRLAVPAWTYCWMSSSNNRGGSACMNIGWEPILAFHMPLRPLGTDVLNYPLSQQQGVGNHPWPKPLKLVRKLIQHWSNEGDTVLDPHVGSGTTLRAAKDLGRKAIGIEIEERYCEIAVKRLAQEVMAL